MVLTNACCGSLDLPLEGQSVFNLCGCSAVVTGEWSEDMDFLAGGLGDDSSAVHLLFAYVGAFHNWNRLQLLKTI